MAPKTIHFFLLFLPFSLVESHPPPRNNSVSSIIVFGDSTVDPGNNNFVPTIFRSNYPPYGKDYKNHTATGRFSNGRLVTDFVASELGIKDGVPAYLDPTLSIQDLLTGVSFASACSGFDPLTASIGNVIDFATQLKLFQRYKSKIGNSIGQKEAEDHIKRAVFVISAGTNDFMVNYYPTPLRKNFTAPQYRQFVVSKVMEFIQNIWNEGARRIYVTGLFPLGCGPMASTLRLPLGSRGCIDILSEVAREYNALLNKELNATQTRLAHLGSQIRYFDVYTRFEDMIRNPARFGFEEVFKSCCGSIKTLFLCNPISDVCPDASKYIFFDAVHPTDKAYYYLTEAAQPLIDELRRA